MLCRRSAVTARFRSGERSDRFRRTDAVRVAGDCRKEHGSEARPPRYMNYENGSRRISWLKAGSDQNCVFDC